MWHCMRCDCRWTMQQAEGRARLQVHRFLFITIHMLWCLMPQHLVMNLTQLMYTVLLAMRDRRLLSSAIVSQPTPTASGRMRLGLTLCKF